MPPGTPPIVSVACGREHSVCVDAEGGVWTWGIGSAYALAHGSKADAPTPRRVGSLEGRRIVKASAGREHTLLLTDDGAVFVAGTDSYGQAGLGGTQAFVRQPALVGGELNGRVVTDVICGEFMSAALCDDGSVFTFGHNKEGGLGHGDRTDAATPRMLHAPPESDFASAGRVVRLSQGGGHALMLTEYGRLFAVGRGRNGQLGRGTAAHESIAAYRLVPVEVTALQPTSSRRVVSLAAGRDHSLALVE